MPEQVVPPVKCLRVDPVNIPHQPRQVRRAGMQHQVVVVAHHAIGQNLRVEAIHRVGDDVEVSEPVIVVTIDWLAAVTTRGDVVDGTGEFDAQGAGHWDMARGAKARPDPKAGSKARS